MKKARKSKKNSLKAYSLVALVIVLVAGFFVIRHFNSNNNTTPRTENQYTKGDQSTNEGSKGSAPSTPITSTTNPSSSTATITTPSGNFVSDHHPNLSGSPAPNSMTSVCDTTPGASCQITFTSNGVVKSLAAQVADSGGSTYWSWTLQNVGLTAGSWQVKAIATLGSQTLSTTDVMALVVSQ
jgi:cytoskeletal protein RodZ